MVKTRMVRSSLIRRGLVTALSLILIVSTFLMAFIVQMKNEGDSVGGLKCFASYEEIRSFVKARADEIRGSLFYRFSTPLPTDSALRVPKDALEYSTTNI
jgi:inhibitor of cysteine peptidase